MDIFEATHRSGFMRLVALKAFWRCFAEFGHIFSLLVLRGCFIVVICTAVRASLWFLTCEVAVTVLKTLEASKDFDGHNLCSP